MHGYITMNTEYMIAQTKTNEHVEIKAMHTVNFSKKTHNTTICGYARWNQHSASSRGEHK